MQALKLILAQGLSQKQDLAAAWTLDGVDSNDVAVMNKIKKKVHFYRCQLHFKINVSVLPPIHVAMHTVCDWSNVFVENHFRKTY